jgi:uncharacterized membrane protein
MESIYKLLELVIVAIEVMSVVILLWGIIMAIKGFFFLLPPFKKKFMIRHPILLIKIELGRYILLGLEVLIAADIIKSIIDPTWQSILILASVVVIRTFMAYFLNHEISEVDEKIVEKEEEELKAHTPQ